MAKARNTRAEILDAAQRLIEAAGIMRLTTKEIAREAGCAEGTLFKYFKRKEDICLAVVLENAPKFRESIAQVRPGARTVAKNLVTLGIAAIAFFEKLIPVTVSLFADVDLLTRHREEMARHERGPHDVFDLISAYIRSEQRLNRIGNKVAPLSAAALLLGPCFHRVYIREALGRDLALVSDQAFVTSLVHTLLIGLNVKGVRNRTAPRLG